MKHDIYCTFLEVFYTPHGATALCVCAVTYVWHFVVFGHLKSINLKKTENVSASLNPNSGCVYWSWNLFSVGHGAQKIFLRLCLNSITTHYIVHNSVFAIL